MIRRSLCSLLLMLSYSVVQSHTYTWWTLWSFESIWHHLGETFPGHNHWFSLPRHQWWGSEAATRYTTPSCEDLLAPLHHPHLDASLASLLHWSSASHITFQSFTTLSQTTQVPGVAQNSSAITNPHGLTDTGNSGIFVSSNAKKEKNVSLGMISSCGDVSKN